MTPYIMSDDELNVRRSERYESLVAIWEIMPASKSGNFAMCPVRRAEVIEHYIDNLRVIKFRYKMPERIQLHKVAGLMAYAIVKYRPISVIHSDPPKKHQFINETFALIHGLSVCAEHIHSPHSRITKLKYHDTWFDSLNHLLHHRNTTPESLAFIFETLCLTLFPENFDIS